MSKTFRETDFTDNRNLYACERNQSSRNSSKEIINESPEKPTMDSNVMPTFRNDIHVSPKPANAPVSFKTPRDMDIAATIRTPTAFTLTLFRHMGVSFQKRKCRTDFPT